MLSLETIS